MRFGVREICNVVLRAKATQTLGSRKFYKNEPILYFDTLKTSSLEGASTTVYATGGRGNTRLVAWEGERTLTFTMEDALISPEGFAILSGAGLIAATEKAPIYVHTTYQYEVKEKNTIELPEEACWNKYKTEDEYFNASADIFVMTMTDGQIDAEPCIPYAVAEDHKTLTCYSHAGTIDVGDVVLVDYYVKRTGGAQLIEITADKFGGNYYLEASTLFRRESDGVDMPAEFIIPNCKVQSNFTFSMASSGDPSTFTFTMDAFPDYTKFDKTHKVLAAIQVIEDPMEDEDNTQRDACVPIVMVNAVDPNITITYDNDSTETNFKVTAIGTSIVGNGDRAKYNKNIFNKNHELDNANVAEIQIDFSTTIDVAKKYRIVQNNPALALYPNDERVDTATNTKKQIFNGGDIAGETLSVLLAERGIVAQKDSVTQETKNINVKSGPVTVKLFEVDENDKDKELIQVVKITNNLSFAEIK